MAMNPLVVASPSGCGRHWDHRGRSSGRSDLIGMHDEAALVAKLHKIEALFARPGTDGERVAAGIARDRIRERLRQLERTEAPIEYRFSLRDAWSQALLAALLRRYGLTPYRYRGQRRTTIIVGVTRTFVEDILWPEFQQAAAVLRHYLHEVTESVISKAISGDFTDVEERAVNAELDPVAAEPRRWAAIGN